MRELSNLKNLELVDLSRQNNWRYIGGVVVIVGQIIWRKIEGECLMRG